MLNMLGTINLCLLRGKLREHGFRRIPKNPDLMRICHELLDSEMVTGEVKFTKGKKLRNWQ